MNVSNINFSLTYKVFTDDQPSYRHNLISLQPPRSTRSSSVVTLSPPPTISSLKITDRSFRYAMHHSSFVSIFRFIPSASPVSSSSTSQLISGPITLIVLFLVSHFNFLLVPCGRLSWLPVSFLLHVKYTLSYRIVSLSSSPLSLSISHSLDV